MTTWAINKDNFACDVVSGTSLQAALAGRFTDAWIAANQPLFVVVPDGTASGAFFNGSSWVNPPASVLPPKTLDWATLNNYLIGLLGTGDIGAAALQTLLEAARDTTGTTSGAKLTRYFYTWYLGQTQFTKTETVARMQNHVPAI